MRSEITTVFLLIFLMQSTLGFAQFDCAEPLVVSEHCADMQMDTQHSQPTENCELSCDLISSIFEAPIQQDQLTLDLARYTATFINQKLVDRSLVPLFRPPKYS